MPRKRGNIGRPTRHSQVVRNNRLNRTAEEQATDNANARDGMASTRAHESEEQRNDRLRANAIRQRHARERATDEHRTMRWQHVEIHRVFTRLSFDRLAFEYEADIDYSSHRNIVIGAMDKECRYCHALTFKNEAPGICRAAGKVVLPVLNPPPEPLRPGRLA